MSRTMSAGAALLALTTVLGSAATAATAAPTAKADPAAAARNAFAHPHISWKHCGQGLQCGELEVPLDYSNYALGTIKLPVSRRVADNPSKRIGSLFTNPGGPGGPATQTVGLFARALGPQVRARFDVVGVAPRGVEGEEMAVCEGKPGEKTPEMDEHLFPLNEKEMAQHLAYDEAFRKTCLANLPKIMQHMSTADTARDMDVARRALGDKQLTYYGISYGTFLGATYAALFPKNVRALVVDGVIDPVAWTTGHGDDAKTKPVTERLLSGQGAHEAIHSALKECAAGGVTRCPEAKTIQEDWAVLTAVLRRGPVVIGDDEQLRYDDLIALTLMVLYSADDIPSLMPALHEMREAVAPSSTTFAAAKVDRAKVKRAADRLRALAAKVDKKHPAPSPMAPVAPKSVHRTTGPASLLADPTDPTEEEKPLYDATFHGVLCSDSINPTDPQAWVRAHARADKDAPGFGPAWMWTSSTCASLPPITDAAYRGPFTKTTSTPVMIIGNHHDPATPYSGAVAYRKMLKSSRLVTLANGYGHGALEQSRCVDKTRTDYLVNQTVPAADVTCKPDRPLFTSLK